MIVHSDRKKKRSCDVRSQGISFTFSMSLLNFSDPSTTAISSFEGQHGTTPHMKIHTTQIYTNSSGSDQTSAKAPPHLLTLTMNSLQRSKNSMGRNQDVLWSMHVFTVFHRISLAQVVTRATTCSTKHAARLNQSTICHI